MRRRAILILLAAGFVLAAIYIGLSYWRDLNLLSSADAKPVVFLCRDNDHVDNICVINTDGSGYRQVVDTKQLDTYTFVYEPKINDLGHIVFVCGAGEDLADICAIDADGSDFRILLKDNAESGFRFYRGIDDVDAQGNVIVTCSHRTATGICRIHSDGTGFEVVISHPETDGYNSFFEGVVNAAGSIIFICQSVENHFNLCGVNLDGSGFHLIVESDGKSIQQYRMNSAGQIVFLCSEIEIESNICKAKYGETGYEVLMKDPRKFDDRILFPFFNPFIDEEGTVVLLCYDESDSGRDFPEQGICTVPFDGGQVSRIHDSRAPTSFLLMTRDGMLLYECAELFLYNDYCITDKYGANRRKFLNGPEDPSNIVTRHHLLYTIPLAPTDKRL